MRFFRVSSFGRSFLFCSSTFSVVLPATPQKAKSPIMSTPSAAPDNDANAAAAHPPEEVRAASDGGRDEAEKPPYWKLRAVVGVLGLDAVVSVVFLAPFLPWVRRAEDAPSQYAFASSLIDLAVLAALRVTLGCLALLVSYWRAEAPPEYHFDLCHPNGERKSREELEREALEEPFGPWFRRFAARPSFAAELAAVATQVWCIAKCLVRMNLEIGTLQDAEPYHPVFWLSVLCTAVLSALEASYLQNAGKLAGQCGKERGGRPPAILRTISNQLLAPLLEEEGEEDEEQPAEANVGSEEEEEENQRAVPDITPDTEYRAQWSDLFVMCYPDLHLIALAFVFLLNAALAQVWIPKFLGNILDALAAAFGNPDDDTNRHMSMWEIPHFMTNVKLLVLTSILAGVFAGIRGSIFTVVGARVNVRLRVKLMDALLSQGTAVLSVFELNQYYPATCSHIPFDCSFFTFRHWLL